VPLRLELETRKLVGIIRYVFHLQVVGHPAASYAEIDVLPYRCTGCLGLSSKAHGNDGGRGVQSALLGLGAGLLQLPKDDPKGTNSAKCRHHPA
jgi:hypothetical protein